MSSVKPKKLWLDYNLESGTLTCSICVKAKKMAHNSWRKSSKKL